MTFLNSQQLAFILDIKKDDARAKMCVAWAKAKDIKNTAKRTKKKDGSVGKLTDEFPQAMPVELLAEQLNLPTLAQSVEDIAHNYLNRPATKKWILCDMPEKAISKAETEGKPAKLKIPPGLKSLLPDVIVKRVEDEWRTRYPKAIV